MTKRTSSAASAAPARSRAIQGAGGRTDTTSRTRAEEIDRARSALEYIDPHSHDTWLRVGMALKSEFGDEAWSLFDDWSSGAENYNRRQNHARWQTFETDGGITIATLFGLARDAGWRDDGTYRVPEPEEIERRRNEQTASEARARQKRQKSAVDAQRSALKVWAMASPVCNSHPYLLCKGVTATPTFRETDAAKASAVLGYEPRIGGQPLEGRLLAIPIKAGDALASLQLIDGAGRKHFIAGGRVTGGYWAAQALPDDDGAGSVLLIGEGVATVLTATAATEALGVAALSSGNLRAVAGSLRKRYPASQIVVLADIDKKTGKADAHAVAAARDAEARLAVPRFPEGPAPDRKDFNDLARHCGGDAVRKAIAGAERVDIGETSAPQVEKKAPKPRVDLVPASSIEPEPITWLWPGYLARGKFHILGGKPGCGKTTLALALAATVSTGGKWPDGTLCEAGNIVIWSGEDDPADTLVPRLIAAGANLERVHVVRGIQQDGETAPFDPAQHMDALAERLGNLENLALVIVDPVVSAVAGDSPKNTETRRALQPLADLAARRKCAVVGITHFTKGTGGRDPVERLTGSLAFGALARVVMIAAKREEHEGDADSANEPKRLFIRAKSNIGPDGGGFGYDLEQRDIGPGIIASCVHWGNAIEGHARDILADAEAIDGDAGGKLGDAVDWLHDFLGKGPKASSDVFAKAKAAGHARSTINRAKSRLRITPVKTGMSGGWTWALPERCSKASEQENMSTFGKFEHLRTQDDDQNGDLEGEL